LGAAGDPPQVVPIILLAVPSAARHWLAVGAVLERGMPVAPKCSLPTVVAKLPLVVTSPERLPLVTACVAPAKFAIPAAGDDAVTQVGQESVPVVVIGPPLIGEVVATFVTPPLVIELLLCSVILPLASIVSPQE